MLRMKFRFLFCILDTLNQLCRLGYNPEDTTSFNQLDSRADKALLSTSIVHNSDHVLVHWYMPPQKKLLEHFL